MTAFLGEAGGISKSLNWSPGRGGGFRGFKSRFDKLMAVKPCQTDPARGKFVAKKTPKAVVSPTWCGWV